MNPSCSVRYLGRKPYEATWAEMKAFTDSRSPETEDEIWVVEHPPVYTFGQAGKKEHLLKETDIPVVQSDRGGQITYHGPGQIVIYTLLDIKRRKLGVRCLVSLLEKSAIALLADYGINGVARKDAPGVYIDGAKICAIGLRVRRGCSFHGLAFNVKMDLTPFELINPCGYPNMPVTQLFNFVSNVEPDTVSSQLVTHLLTHLGYTDA